MAVKDADMAYKAHVERMEQEHLKARYRSAKELLTRMEKSEEKWAGVLQKSMDGLAKIQQKRVEQITQTQHTHSEELRKCHTEAMAFLKDVLLQRK